MDLLGKKVLVVGLARTGLATLRFLKAKGARVNATERRLREEMKVPLPAAADVRADPVPAADFSLKDLDGNTVSLSDFRHKVVLVQQWTTW